MRLICRASTALAAALVLATGCASDNGSLPTIDLDQLDTGNYQSTPRDPNGAKPDRTGSALEAIRIGAVVPLPMDVDASYKFQRMTTPTARTTPTIPGSITGIEKADFPAVTSGLIAGWVTSGERRVRPFVGRQAWIYVYRFGTEAEATSAAQKIAEKQQEKGSGQAVSIPGRPESRNSWKNRSLDSWLVHGSMLIGVRLNDPLTEPPDPAAALDFASKAYTKTIESLGSYSPTPPDKIAELPIDVDGMLSRTLPGDEDQWVAGVPEGAVEPAQAALIRERVPGTAKPAYADAGVDLVASDGTARVYRTSDSTASERLLEAFVAPDAEFLKQIDSPRNLPIARCFDKKDSSVKGSAYQPVCYVAYGRFLARVTDSDIQDLHQRTSAQYKLLAVDR